MRSRTHYTHDTWHIEDLVLTSEVIVIIKNSAQAQPNYVIVLEQEDEGETQYLYTGDLW